MDGPESGVYCATPLSGLNTAERMLELLREEDITDPNVRLIASVVPDEGVACVEAPRGTLTHHYWTDENGISGVRSLLCLCYTFLARPDAPASHDPGWEGHVISHRGR